MKMRKRARLMKLRMKNAPTERELLEVFMRGYQWRKRDLHSMAKRPRQAFVFNLIA